MKTFLLRVAIASTLALAMPVLWAQGFPNKPVTIVVPYSAGGPVDNFIRALGPQLTERWR